MGLSAIGLDYKNRWVTILDANSARGLALDAVIFLKEPTEGDRECITSSLSMSLGPVYELRIEKSKEATHWDGPKKVWLEFCGRGVQLSSVSLGPEPKPRIDWAND